MSGDPIERVPAGSYGIPGWAPGDPAELWTAWRDDDDRARLTCRRSGTVRRVDHPSAIDAAIRILRDLAAARGRYTAETGRCAFCSTTALGSRRDWQVGACAVCAELLPAHHLAAVASAARQAIEDAHGVAA